MFATTVERKPHVRLWGIGVRVEPFFVLVILLLGFGLYTGWLLAAWFVIASVSVLVHELGHALAFRAYGATPSIVLHGMGGLTSAQADLTPGRAIVVSLAGPMATLIPFGIPAILVARSGMVTSLDGQDLLQQILFVNVVWALLNLVPLLPLDGGAVLASAIDWVAPGRGRRITNVVSIGLAGLVLLYGLGSGFFFLAMLGGVFVVTNVMELSRPAAADRQSDALVSIRQAMSALGTGQAFVAEHLAREVLGQRGTSPQVRAFAAELVGWARLMQGDVAGAQLATGALPGGASPSVPYQAASALAAGARSQGVSLLAWSLVNQPDDPMLRLAVGWVALPEVAGELAHELILQGPGGWHAASRLAATLGAAGHTDAASTVGAMLTGFEPTQPRAV